MLRISTVVTVVKWAIFLFAISLPEGAKSKEQRLTPSFDVVIDGEATRVFSNIITKRDVIIVGGGVSIIEPVHSYGGDVYIFASDLEISAPIDTRVHVRLHTIWGEAEPNRRPVPATFIDAQHALNSFIAFHTWHDYWDAGEGQYKFRYLSSEALSAGSGLLPLMPFAPVPAIPSELKPWGPSRNGLPPVSDVDFNSFHSGDIIIYTHTIKFCDSCIRSRVFEPAPPMGDMFDRERVRFLNAGGLSGARPGLGGPHGCPFNYVAKSKNPFAVYCDERRDVLGGLSGLPGRGGDAGNVSIFFVGNSESARREIESQELYARCVAGDCAEVDFRMRLGQSIAALTEVSGGAATYNRRLRTPSFSELSSSDSRQAFMPEGPAFDVGHLSGADGLLSIDSISSDVALNKFSQTIAPLDLRIDYKIGDLISSLSTTKTADSVVIRDLLAAVMVDHLESRAANLLENVSSILRGSFEVPARKDAFSSLSCQEGRVVGLTSQEYQLARRLCDFQPLEGKVDPLRSYLYRVGGLLRRSEPAAVLDPQLERLIAEQYRAGQLLAKVAESVSILNNNFFDFTTDRVKERYETKIKQVEEALGRAVKAMEAQPSNIFDGLIAIGKRAGNEFKAIAGAWKGQDYGALAGAAGSAIARVGQVFEYLAGNADDDDLYKAVAVVENELRSLRVSFEEFLSETSNAKSELLGRQSDDLREYVLAAGRLNLARRVFLMDLEHMLKSALTAYISDPYRNLGSLELAIDSIRDAIEHFPNVRLGALPRSAAVDCQGQIIRPLIIGKGSVPVGCATLAAAPTTYIIRSKEGSRMPALPLIAVAAGRGSYMVHFEWLFRPDELERQVTGAGIRSWRLVDASRPLP